MDRRFDLIWALTAAVIGLAVLVTSAMAPARRVLDQIGPFGMPIVLGAALVLLGGWQGSRAVRALRAGRIKDRHEGTEDDDRYPSDPRRGFGFIAGSFIYVALLQPLGYLIMTPIVSALGLWALGYRSKLKLVALVLGYTLATFWLFDRVMSVPIPVGPLRGPLVDAGLISRFR